MSPAHHLTVPTIPFARSANQRAVLGRFAIAATALMVPTTLEHRERDGTSITSFHRRLSGADLPIVYALVESQSSTDVIESAVRLLRDEPHSDIIRLFIAGQPASSTSCPPPDGYWTTAFHHTTPEALRLGPSYEDFLGSLGSHTRRDLRRLLRRADTNGFQFEFQNARVDGAAERHLLGKANLPADYHGWEIDAADRFAAAQPQGFHAAIRSSDGELLSLCAGFISDGAAIVLYQLNHSRYRKASLSLTARGFLIRYLIGRGVHELIFPGGAAGLLAASCADRDGTEFVLVKRSFAAAAKALAIAAFRPQSHIGLAVRGWFRPGNAQQLTSAAHTSCR